jgi:hypothetical protein
MEISREELDRIVKLARMAGFTNGEGCFTLSNNRYPFFEIDQKYDVEDLKLFVEMFGGKIAGPYKENQYRWITGRRETVRLVYETLKPWLSRVKREKAERVLEIADSKALKRGSSKYDIAEHGSILMYNRGCKCVECKSAIAAYQRDLRAGRRG